MWIRRFFEESQGKTPMENLWIRRAVIHPCVEKHAPQRVYSMKADLIPARAESVFGSFCVCAGNFSARLEKVSTVSTACGGISCGGKAQRAQGVKPCIWQVIQYSSTSGGLFLVVLQADGHHFGNALLLHGPAVQGVAALHGALAVRNDDKLRV